MITATLTITNPEKANMLRSLLLELPFVDIQYWGNPAVRIQLIGYPFLHATSRLSIWGGDTLREEAFPSGCSME